MVQTTIKRMFDDETLCLMIIFQCLMAKSLILPNHCAIVCSCTASVKWAMKIPKKSSIFWMFSIQDLEVSYKSWRVSPNHPKYLTILVFKPMVFI